MENPPRDEQRFSEKASGDTSPPRRLRLWTVRLLLFFVLLFIGAELFARFCLGLGDPPLSIAHRTIEYMFKANQDVYRFGNHIVINEYGMRSNSFPPTKLSPDELRILVFGDSVLNGGTLTDQADLATSIAKERLTKLLQRQIVVGNVSAGSWGVPNQLAWQQEYGWLDCDIVLIVLSVNDVDDVPNFHPLDPNSHPTVKPVSAAWEGTARYLLPRISRFTPISKRSSQSIAETHVYEDSAAQRKQVRQDVVSMIELALESGRPVGVIRWWYPGMQDGGIDSRQEIAMQELLDATREAGAVVYDMTESLQAIYHTGRIIYRDGLHPNPTGQGVLANFLTTATTELMKQKQQNLPNR